MAEINTVILLPFFAAFLVFIARFYFREAARSIFGLSFLLAVGTLLALFVYLLLGMMGALPEHGGLEFGIVGLLLLGVSIFRMKQL